MLTQRLLRLTTLYSIELRLQHLLCLFCVKWMSDACHLLPSLAHN